MTPWDAGNDLVYCADILAEKESDLRKGGFAKQADVVRKARLQIGTEFNSMKAHDFGLPEESNVSST